MVLASRQGVTFNIVLTIMREHIAFYSDHKKCNNNQ